MFKRVNYQVDSANHAFVVASVVGYSLDVYLTSKHKSVHFLTGDRVRRADRASLYPGFGEMKSDECASWCDYIEQNRTGDLVDDYAWIAGDGCVIASVGHAQAMTIGDITPAYMLNLSGVVARYDQYRVIIAATVDHKFYMIAEYEDDDKSVPPIFLGNDPYDAVAMYSLMTTYD